MEPADDWVLGLPEELGLDSGSSLVGNLDFDIYCHNLIRRMIEEDSAYWVESFGYTFPRTVDLGSGLGLYSLADFHNKTFLLFIFLFFNEMIKCFKPRFRLEEIGIYNYFLY